MDYNNMTKEDLIVYIKECEAKRAFTYEDQMKLAFLDTSPFTLWASDRNCKIKLWTGQCESLYGYKKDDVLGKDFVKLFVAPDEQKAAREDQLSVIDDNATFHNIANDVGKNGNTLRLLTNCWRLQDPNSGEYWNAEMGLIIDFFKQEEARLAQIIADSRLLKSRVTQFLECIKQYKRQFVERRKSINEAMRECDRKAVAQKKRKEFQTKVQDIKSDLIEIDKKLSSLTDAYLEKVESCNTASACEILIDKFKDEHESILSQFEDLITDFQEIAIDYDNSGVVFGKDSVLKDTAIIHEAQYSRAYNLKVQIEKEIDEYKSIVDYVHNSTMLSTLNNSKECVDSIIKKISNIETEIYEKVEKVDNERELLTIRKDMEHEYLEIEKSLEEIKQELEGQE